jgi:hypothetical protein
LFGSLSSLSSLSGDIFAVFGYYPDIIDCNGLRELSRGFGDGLEVVDLDGKEIKDEDRIFLRKKRRTW